MQFIHRVNPKRWAEQIRRNARRVAEHRSAPAVVFLLELIACAFVPLPNALIMVAMVTAAPRKWLRFAASAAAGSLVAGLLLYVVSRLLFESWGQRLLAFYGATERWHEVVAWVQSGWGLGIVFVAAMTTGFFRLTSLAAGFTAINPLAFAVVLAASRGVRWTAECAAIKFVGDRLRLWPRQYIRYAAFGAGLLAFAVILVFVFSA
ncbi:MAG: YqaA family protein [Blastocatellia bacterium]